MSEAAAMTIQTLSTPSGDKMVVMSMDDYEDLMDSLHYRAAAAAQGPGEELLDTAGMAALLAAPSPLSFWRQHRGLSSRELAEKAGLSDTEFARMEEGSTGGDVLVYARLAEMLNVQIDDLVIM